MLQNPETGNAGEKHVERQYPNGIGPAFTTHSSPSGRTLGTLTWRKCVVGSLPACQ